MIRSRQCWVPFTKVTCEMIPPLAKGQSARDHVFTKENYGKILFHVQ